MVSIPSPCFSVSMGSMVSLAATFALLVASVPACFGLASLPCLGVCLFTFSWVLGHLFIAPRPVSLMSSSLLFLCGRVLFLVVTSASFGSQVPFTMWSPFGTSQGLLGALSRSILRVPFTWWSPFGSFPHLLLL